MTDYIETNLNEPLAPMIDGVVATPVTLGVGDTSSGQIGALYLGDTGIVLDTSDDIHLTTTIGQTYTITANGYSDNNSYSFSLDGAQIGNDPFLDGTTTFTYTFVATSDLSVFSIAGIGAPAQTGYTIALNDEISLFTPTAGDDNGVGTESVDTVYLLGGDDIFNALDGDDTVNGGLGNDTIDGGAGNDRLIGSNGADDLNGGIGNDNISGGSGDDFINGGDGDDNLNGNFGDDVILGGIGNDAISGADGNDTISGGVDDDLIWGNDGDDVLQGNDGTDTMDGGLGADLLFGGEGNDRLIGGADADDLFGENGNDNISGGEGDDLIYGGDGHDGLGGNFGNDDIYGGNGNDAVRGGEGHDTINGGDGKDNLFGDSGNDTIAGGTGNDKLEGGSGFDHFVFAEGDGADYVRDFNVDDDSVDFSGVEGLGLFSGDLEIFPVFSYLDYGSQVGNDVVFEFGGGDRLTLANVNMDDLSSANFAFHSIEIFAEG